MILSIKADWLIAKGVVYARELKVIYAKTLFSDNWQSTKVLTLLETNGADLTSFRNLQMNASVICSVSLVASKNVRNSECYL